MKKPEIIELEEHRASIAWATESTAGQNETEGMKKDKNLRGGTARNKSSLIDILRGLPETIILEKHEASNFTAWICELLVQESLSETGYEYIYNSVYNGRSPRKESNNRGPDFTVFDSKSNQITPIEVKHRAKGYTRETEFFEYFNKFNGLRGILVFFNGYDDENLRKVMSYCNLDNNILISLPPVPYKRQGDTFIYDRESLLQWRQDALAILKGKMEYYLPKLISQNEKTISCDNDDRITDFFFPLTNSSMIVSSMVEQGYNVFLSNCRGQGSCICNVSNSIHDVPVFQNFIKNFIISNRMSPVLFHLTILKQEMSDGKDTSLGDKNLSFNSLTFPNFHLMLPIHHLVLHQTGDVERTTTKSYHHLMNEVNVSTDNIIETEVYPLMFHHHHLFKIVGG